MSTRGKTVVVASGFFNPLHAGHLDYLEAARRLGDALVVVVNNDPQVGLKGSRPFMNERDRLRIVSALACVDQAVLSFDSDRSVRRTLVQVRCWHPGSRVVFANGGDVRTREQVREADECARYGIELAFGVGGGKTQSSSSLLQSHPPD